MLRLSELTEDTHERTVLLAFGYFWEHWATSRHFDTGSFLEQNPDTAWGNTSLAIAGLLVFSSLITYFSTSGHDNAVQSDTHKEKFSVKSHFRSLAEVLNNPF